MKNPLTIFLQIVIIVLGIGILTALIWEPQLEGANTHATNFEIYFKDPFLAFMYVFSIPIFIALFKGFQFLGFVKENKTFSEPSVRALQTIKYCLFITAGAIVAADIFLVLATRSNGEDAAGAVMLGIISTFVLVVIATAAGVFQRVLQKGVDIKSENDLTV